MISIGFLSRRVTNGLTLVLAAESLEIVSSLEIRLESAVSGRFLGSIRESRAISRVGQSGTVDVNDESHDEKQDSGKLHGKVRFESCLYAMLQSLYSRSVSHLFWKLVVKWMGKEKEGA